MKNLNCPFDVKEVTESGTFEGLASVYGGNPDLGGDVVQAGAFKEFKTTKDGQIRILDGHNIRMPIGKGVLTDTHVGLALKGQLNLKVGRARDVHELMKDGIIDGLSIGFDVIGPDGEEIKDGVRYLKKLRLWEVSATCFPMNESARISAVKQAKQITNIREYEDFLRDVGGFSKAQAKLLASAWNTLPGQRDVGGEVDDVKQLIDDLTLMARQFT